MTSEEQMQRRLEARKRRLFAEFGTLAADSVPPEWRIERRVLELSWREHDGQAMAVLPRFQFDADGKPLHVIAAVLEIFKDAAPWSVALWFNANNGWLWNSARPVDLLIDDPEAVILAARRDSQPAA